MLSSGPNACDMHSRNAEPAPAEQSVLGIEYSASVGHGRGCRLPSEDCVLVEIMGRLLPLLNQFAQVATCIRSKSLSAPSQVTRGLGRTFVVIHQNVHVRPIAERAAIGHNVGVVHIDHHLRSVSSQGAGGGIVGWARTSISRRACADRSMSMSTAGCAGANPKLIHGRRPHAVAVAAPIPRLAPVTSAILPANAFVIFSWI